MALHRNNPRDREHNDSERIERIVHQRIEDSCIYWLWVEGHVIPPKIEWTSLLDSYCHWSDVGLEKYTSVILTPDEVIQCLNFALHEAKREGLLYKVETKTPLEIALYNMRRKARELLKEREIK